MQFYIIYITYVNTCEKMSNFFLKTYYRYTYISIYDIYKQENLQGCMLQSPHKRIKFITLKIKGRKQEFVIMKRTL